MLTKLEALKTLRKGDQNKFAEAEPLLVQGSHVSLLRRPSRGNSKANVLCPGRVAQIPNNLGTSIRVELIHAEARRRGGIEVIDDPIESLGIGGFPHLRLP
jgi:hypothetical protein